ncbi:Sybindin-like protein [Cladochytrium replicatum]|nr:Sybindin-like protein [Cladochytrium replicatum]
MAIYNLYIFDRHCACIFFTSWNRRALPGIAIDGANGGDPASAAAVAAAAGGTGSPGGHAQGGMVGSYGGDISLEEEAKLVYGVVFSLRNLVKKLSGKSDGFISYRTNVYRLHYYETASGLKFVMNTDPGVENLSEAIRMIYSQIYVEYITKNPLVTFDAPITNELFRNNLNNFVKNLPGFER